MVGPGGGLPWFGDYGGTQNADPLMIAAFERAAAVYHDGRFKWAAHRIYQACPMRANENTPAQTYNGWHLFGFSCAYAWADDDIPETVPDYPSEVLRRNNGYLDKCILRSGWDRNDFYAMIDLIDGSEHGDNDSLGLMSVYKDGAYALSDKGGRDRANHSLVIVREKPEDFPFAPLTEINRWQHAVIDLKFHWSWNAFPDGVDNGLQYSGIVGSDRHERIPTAFLYDPEKEFAFLLRPAGTGRATLYLDDVKLVGKNGARLLDDFEEGHRPWIGNFERSTDAHAGRYSGSFTMDFLTEAPWVGQKFPVPLDIVDGDDDRLDFWYKIVAEEPQRFGTLTIGDRTGYPHNYIDHLLPMFQPSLEEFRDMPASTHAAFRLDREDAAGRPQTQEREVLFVKNKLLWVRDVLKSDPQAPYVAGPLWYSKGFSPRRGTNWIDSWDEANLLTYFIPRDGRTVSIGTTDRIAAHDFPMPCFACQTAMGTGGEVAFDTLLLPHPAGQDAGALADEVQVLYDQFGATLVRVGEDLLLLNRSGKTVRAAGLETDARYCLLRMVGGRMERAEGEAGKQITYQGQPVTLE